jgi:hypothetical protein
MWSGHSCPLPLTCCGTLLEETPGRARLKACREGHPGSGLQVLRSPLSVPHPTLVIPTRERRERGGICFSAEDMWEVAHSSLLLARVGITAVEARESGPLGPCPPFPRSAVRPYNLRVPAQYPKHLAKLLRKYLVEKNEEPPKLGVLERLFEILFFASLHREESQSISCRVAFIDPAHPDPRPPSRVVANRWSHFPLSQKLELSVANLVKISQAVDPWGSTLAVHADTDGQLWIWGLVDQSVHFSTYLVKESDTGPEMPGMFQAAITGVGEICAYKRDVIVGELKRDVIITRQHRVFQSGPLYEKLVPWIDRYRNRVFEKAAPSDELRTYWARSLGDLWVSAISRLLIGIHRYGHGGAVLISDRAEGLTPKYSLEYPRLADSLVRLGVHQINKEVYTDRVFKDLDRNVGLPGAAYLNEAVESNELDDTRDELKGCVRFLTSLSRVDGLLWFDSDLRLKAFGVEIAEQNDPADVALSQGTDGSTTTPMVLSHYGMRHRSMVRYCAYNPQAVGFVVSQDGALKAVTRIDASTVVWDKVRIHSLRTPRSRRARRETEPERA